jgi:hypothetical protein
LVGVGEGVSVGATVFVAEGGTVTLGVSVSGRVGVALGGTAVAAEAGL